jgi:hypothetical protein
MTNWHISVHFLVVLVKRNVDNRSVASTCYIGLMQVRAHNHQLTVKIKREISRASLSRTFVWTDGLVLHTAYTYKIKGNTNPFPFIHNDLQSWSSINRLHQYTTEDNGYGCFFVAMHH